MSYFKIRNRQTGLFSMGGMSPRFTKKGKIWTSRGALGGHLALVDAARVYRNCDLIEFQEMEISNVTITIHIHSKLEEKRQKEEKAAAKKAKQRAAEAERASREKETRERQELARLKAKYEAGEEK